MLHRLLPLFGLLMGAVAIGACDSGHEPTTQKESFSVEAARPLADLHLTFPDIDPRTVRLDSVFRASTRLSYEVRVEGDAVAAQVVGSALVLTPQEDGAASVHVKATDLGGRSAETSFGVTIAIPSRIAAALPPQPFEVTTTPAPPFKVALRSLIHHMDGLPLVYEIDTPTPTWLNASLLQGDSLGLAPDQAGEAVVTVRVFDPSRKRSDQVTIPVRVALHPGRTCDRAPDGKSDPLPFQTGQTVSFSFKHQILGGRYGATMTRRTGTLTWTIRERHCDNGLVRLAFDELQVYTQIRTNDSGVPIDTTHIEQTIPNNVSFSRHGVFPTVGCCVGRRPSGGTDIPGLPASYFAPFKAGDDWSVGTGSSSYGYAVSLNADALGLTSWNARSWASSGRGPGSSEAMEVARL